MMKTSKVYGVENGILGSPIFHPDKKNALNLSALFLFSPSCQLSANFDHLSVNFYQLVLFLSFFLSPDAFILFLRSTIYMREMESTQGFTNIECEDSGVLGNIPDPGGCARSGFVLTSDLRHFIDMVYLYATQKGLLPAYVSRTDFKKDIDGMRESAMLCSAFVEPSVESSEDRLLTSKNAYMYALIVYGSIKEMATLGDFEAAKAYDVLKNLMPYKIF